MAEYIAREAAIEAALEKSTMSGLDDKTARDIRNALNAVPAADVKPVVHTTFDFSHADDDIVSGINCCACGEGFFTWGSFDWRKLADTWNYCPHCGADMRERR